MTRQFVQASERHPGWNWHVVKVCDGLGYSWAGELVKAEDRRSVYDRPRMMCNHTATAAYGQVWSERESAVEEIRRYEAGQLKPNYGPDSLGR